MVKKLQKMAAKKKAQSDSSLGGVLPAGLLDGELAKGLKDSAQKIWAAGLGAFSKSQGEGGKLFDTLVKEGMNLQQKTRSKAEDKLGAVASKMSGMADDVSSRAGQHWDKLESIFEERVARALNRLGVPSSKDIDALIERIDRLSAAVGLEAAPPAKAAKAVKTSKASAKVAPKAVAKPATKAAPKSASKAKSAASPFDGKAAPRKASVTAKAGASAKTAAKPAAKKAAAKPVAKSAATKPAARKVASKPAAPAPTPAAEAAAS